MRADLFYIGHADYVAAKQRIYRAPLSIHLNSCFLACLCVLLWGNMAGLVLILAAGLRHARLHRQASAPVPV